MGDLVQSFNDWFYNLAPGFWDSVATGLPAFVTGFFQGVSEQMNESPILNVAIAICVMLGLVLAIIIAIHFL
jgi:hypothetical protein